MISMKIKVERKIEIQPGSPVSNIKEGEHLDS